MKSNTRKIVLMGLDNGGKTSIILSLKGVKNLPAFSALSPTKNSQISKFNLLDTEFRIWDFGGQEQYRKDHLLAFREKLKETDKFIFVLDIQDIARYDLALDYLRKVSQLLIEHDIKVEFSIFLHKYDPDLHITNPEITEDKIEGIIKKIDLIMKEKLEYDLFKTTIYATFQKLKI
jgi:GTPase SAR1 family protein